MIYEPLLLPYGGIIHDADRAPLDPTRAHMAIGIGGNGIDALRMLKARQSEQLIPDDPEAALPQYRGFPLLAIDSDPEVMNNRWGCPLEDREFFSLQVYDLQRQLLWRQSVTDDPFLSWMDVDHASLTMAPQSLGGIRQVGRFLLTRHAPALVSRLTGLIMDALNHVGTQDMDIFVLAGLGGGTGSGCFLDVCYLLRHIAQVHGIQLTIHGYFFLPEVVGSKAPDAIGYMEANGYAALKELDYLMDLRDRSDVFCHTYAPGLHVQTQEPPVDSCCLLGATRDGALHPEAYGYACETAAEHILAAATDCTHPANAIPMANHQADTANALANQPQLSGCRQRYRAIGVSTARIPRRELFTYLACGFFDRFHQTVGPAVRPVDKTAVENFARELKLTPEDVYSQLVDTLPSLLIPDIQKAALRRSPRPPLHLPPPQWDQAGNTWLNTCGQKVHQNARGLTVYPDRFDHDRLNAQSLTQRVFRRLWELCLDPTAGPWFAAKLLQNEPCDLLSFIDEGIRQYEDRCNLELLHLKEAEKDLERSKDDFYNAMFPSKYYQSYISVTQCIYHHRFHIQTLTAGIQTLRKLRDQLQQLYREFFRPLVEMLDVLGNTFRENTARLQLFGPSGVDRPLLTLMDIRQLCDPLIQGLALNTMLPAFMDTLLRNHTMWLRDDKYEFFRLIRRYMVAQFPTVDQMSIEDHLYQKFPQTQGNPGFLQNALYSALATPEYHRATPLMSFDPQSPMHHPVRLTVSDVPQGVLPVYGAYNDLHLNLPPDLLPLLRQTQNRFCIRTVNTYAGLPLFSLASLQRMRNCYLSALGREWGLHLYAPTGRGPGDSGKKDWSKLSDPFPGSLLPQLQPLAQETEALYIRAEAASLIFRDPASGRDVLLRLPPIPEELACFQFPEQDYTHHFCRDTIRRLDERTDALRSQAERICLPFGHPDPEQQRRLNLDHLILSPTLRKLLSDQLESLEHLCRYRGRLERLLDDKAREAEDLKLFSLCLFCGLLGEPGELSERKLLSRPIYLHPGNMAPVLLTDEADMLRVRFPLYQVFLAFRQPAADPALREALTRQTQPLPDSAPNGQPLDRNRVCDFIACVMDQAHTFLSGTYLAAPTHVREFFEHLQALLDEMVVEERPAFTGPIPPLPPMPPDIPTQADLSVPSPDENGAIRVMDPEDGAFLEIYPDRDLHTAVEPASGQTRPLRPDMLVWGNGNWFHAVHCKLLFP